MDQIATNIRKSGYGIKKLSGAHIWVEVLVVENCRFCSKNRITNSPFLPHQQSTTLVSAPTNQ